MFCVLSVSIYAHLSTPVLHFHSVLYAFLELAFCIYFNFVYQIVRVAPKIKIQRG
jgi:hypothetical protein